MTQRRNWKAVFDDWEASNLPISIYCKTNHISTSAFYKNKRSKALIQLTNRLALSRLPLVSGVLTSHNFSLTSKSSKKLLMIGWIFLSPSWKETTALILSVLTVFVLPPILLKVSRRQRIKSTEVLPRE